jgi:hypothetical protein
MADLNIEELQDTIDVLQVGLQKLVDKRAFEENADEVAKLTVLIKTQRGLISEQNEKLKKLLKSQEDLEKSQKKLTEVFIKTIDGVDDFRQAIVSTEFSFNNFDKSIKGLATGTTEATGGLFELALESLGASRTATAFRIGTAGASKAVGIFSDQLIKQADNLLQAFDSIASIGGAAGLTSIQIEEIGRNAGFSGEALKFFGKLTKDQGTNLLAFGGNVSDGTRAFSEFIDVGENQLKVYSRLGISQNQLAEYQAFYADNLLRSGVSIDRGSRGMDSLRKTSLEYLDILLALSSITGQTLEQQQKAMDLAAADELFVAKQSQLNLERNAILAEANNLEEGQRKEELKARAEEIQNRIDFNKIMATRFSEEQVGAQKATAFREMIASDGLVLTESSAVLEMLFSSVGKSAMQLFQDFANASSEEDFLRAFTNIESTFYSAIEETNLRLGPLATSFGDASREIQSVLGLDAKSMGGAAIRSGIAEEQIFEELLKIIELIRAERENAELSADFVGPRQPGLQSDPVVEARAQAEAAGRALREKESQFYTNLIEKTFPAFTKALEVLTTTIQNASPNQVAATTTGISVTSAILTGLLSLLGAGAVGAGAGAVFRRGGPAPTPVTPPGPSNSPTIRQQIMRPGQTRPMWTTVPNPNYVPPAPPAPPAPPPPPRPNFATRLAGVATKVARFGPAATVLGAGLSVYQGVSTDAEIRRQQEEGEISASEARTARARNTGGTAGEVTGGIAGAIAGAKLGAIGGGIAGAPFAGVGAGPGAIIGGLLGGIVGYFGGSRAGRAGGEELGSIYAETTGKPVDTISTVDTITPLNNSFDELVSTTDMLIEAFGSLNTFINSSNVGTISSTLTNSFDELVSTTAMLVETFGSLNTSINSSNIVNIIDSFSDSETSSTRMIAAQEVMAQGPETEYLGKLQGTEIIQPTNSDSVLSRLATTPESTSDANINSNEIQTRMSEMYRSNMVLVETLNYKLDTMISKLEDGNYIQERILSNTV